MSCSPQGLLLMLLPVDRVMGNDNPVLFGGQLADPLYVLNSLWEPVPKVHDLLMFV